jgi:hypothetical protein
MAAICVHLGPSLACSSSGTRASGIWSRPVARLLGAVPKRRLTKLEAASPSIAPAP